ncbi:MAG TPA: DUF1800 family protein [Baekduia sp.]|nr:DUF1800 family protein [Baekduia sp.]
MAASSIEKTPPTTTKRKVVAKKKATAKKPAAKKTCRTVVKKSGGKTKRVKVCTTKKTTKKTTAKKKATIVAAPLPKFTVTDTTPVLPPSEILPPSPATPIDPNPPAPVDPETPVSGGVTQTVEGNLTAAQAERLLWRAGFGPRPGQVAAFTGKDVGDAIRELTRPTTVTLTGPAPRQENGLPLFPLDMWGHDHCVWLDRMVRCDQPLTERMALIFHDWFATSRGIVSAYHGQNQIQTIRNKCFGTFDDLLTEMTKDPAMLVWLNGISNTKWAPNENYAREVMELFTLGAERGAYTETDIREAAKALTGWRADWDNVFSYDWRNFRYDANRHTTGNKTIFGKTGDYGWQDVVRLCVEHPLHASFFCTKLWSYFVPSTPDDETLARLCGIYVNSGRQIRPVVEAILQHPECLNGPRMVLPPVVYAAGLLRATGGAIKTDNWAYLCDMAGQRLYWPPNVSGWNDRRWLDSSTLRGRWHIAREGLAPKYVDPWPTGGSNYDPQETNILALQRALETLDNPSITEATRTELSNCSASIGAQITATWQRSPYRAMRQNALRMLIATSPDCQTR